ncbi:lipid A 4'-phosphatase [Nitratiruptor sp. YY08-26]|uniref:phosphatase PAP2 family protein n=1 Tax=unclassified Nitratiruptor TaxID=2624044 RepID=UPI001916648B|nr:MULTISPECIES: phosphatase PAP2 family protein [unclassified Nitratiruptor]BCD62009.1 lipid A 4'-phosphatase [Nitratiruptor sp. YY08-13]BCD65945.1 lipid A 4'-phosphatase [Nitratiruptor sp. YY08-26]
MRVLFIFLTALAICFFFYLYPQIDLTVSSFFYHNGFYLKDTVFAKTIYKLTIIITAIFGIGTLGLLLFEIVTKKEIIKKKILIYLLLSLLLGPGLLVNVVFKNHFGRARPSQIHYFGGSKKFTPAGVIADECKKNCSFTSGHAAAAFYFLALVPLFRSKKRYLVALLALLWGSIVGFVRIIQGGHFLSDIVCSAVVVFGVSYIVYILMFERKNDEAIGSNTSNE